MYSLDQAGAAMGQAAMLFGLLPVLMIVAAAAAGSIWLLAGIGVASLRPGPRRLSARRARGPREGSLVCRDCGRPREGCERRCPDCGSDGWLSAAAFGRIARASWGAMDGHRRAAIRGVQTQPQGAWGTGTGAPVIPSRRTSRLHGEPGRG